MNEWFNAMMTILAISVAAALPWYFIDIAAEHFKRRHSSKLS